MEAPFTVRITCTDSAGKEFQLFENRELTYEALVAVQEAVTGAFVSLGKAAVAANKGQGK